MYNNTAERRLRPAAVGHKNYYGSHATWSGKFGAVCMSLFQTAILHGLNPEAYMPYILDELAKGTGGSRDLYPLLPWNIPEQTRQAQHAPYPENAPEASGRRRIALEEHRFRNRFKVGG
jgi:hypothetical protein